MSYIRKKKKVLVVVFSIMTLYTANSFGQPFTVTYTPSGEDGGYGGISSSDFANDAAYEQIRHDRANASNLREAYRIEVSRFNQKLFISANAVHNMNAGKTQVAKYPYALDLYQRSLVNYKKLEAISVSAAEKVKNNGDIKGLQNQQDQTMNEAVDDYHKGQYVQELGDNKAQIVQEELMTFESERCLSKEEKSELEVLKVRIKDAQNQIAKLHQSSQSLEKIKDQLNHDYHVLAQSVNSLAKITQKALEVYAPNDKIAKTVKVTQAVFNTYVDEAIANGKSPSEAIKKALEEGYNELKKEKQDQKKTPTDKRIEMVKEIFKQTQTEYRDWQKMDKNRKEVMNKINETLDFTNDIVQRNQKLIDEANAKGEKMLNRCIDEYLKRRLP
jgi:hypothetical protein